MRTEKPIRAIILAGDHSFARCRATSYLPTALWPVVDKTALERLLAHLAHQGIKHVTICSNGDDLLLRRSIHVENHLELSFLNRDLPVGTAGCLRDSAGDAASTLYLVFPANITSPPKIDTLISVHRYREADLTVMFNPKDGDDGLMGQPADIYICNPGVIGYIPKDGYFDIKEGLIPKMLRAGKTIHAAVLRNHAGNFRDREGYLSVIADYLENFPEQTMPLKHYNQCDLQNVWTTASTKIEPAARIIGPTVLMDGAHVSKSAVVIGPTIIGRNVYIGENSIIINSVLWDNVHIGPKCTIKRCIVDYNASVPRNTYVEEESIPFKPAPVLNSVRSILEVAKDKTSKLYCVLQAQLGKINEILSDRVQLEKTKIISLVALILVFIAFLWSYWPNLKDLWNVWQRSDEYSSGLLVPFIAAYILLSRRQDIAKCPLKLAVFWGLSALILAQAARFFGLFFMYRSAIRLSIVLSIAAVVLLLFGWQIFRKVITMLLFLCLMLPWPNRIQTAVTLPMQRWATSSAVFCLEMLGYEVLREGNIIHIGSATVAVAEACNGLRMVTAFFVISGMVVLLVKRAWWEKLIILSSSLPIALLCNTIRLTITAIIFTILSGEYWEKVFHDFGGYAMMPLALVIVVTELWLLTKLTTRPTEERAIIIARQNE